MSRQRRRSISTPGHLYERLQAQCERDGQPVAAVVQGLIEQHLARVQAPKVGDRVRILDRDWGSKLGTLMAIGNIEYPAFPYAVQVDGYACERWVRSVEAVRP